MAINPNTDFTAGAVLTAAQQNRFPRGVMAFVQSTNTDGTITAEEVQLTSPSFTAVANRYYRITYVEPSTTASTTYMIARLRITNLAGLQLTRYDNTVGTGVERNMVVSWTGTFSAGPIVIVGTLQSQAGTASANRSATQPAQLLVEDIGPA
jgi:hypothetical protein